jgi:hypothetical protein
MIRSALVVSMVMGVRIWVARFGNGFFQPLDFFTESSDIRPDCDLLGGRQLAQSGLDVFGDWIWHGEYNHDESNTQWSSLPSDQLCCYCYVFLLSAISQLAATDTKHT